MDVLPTRIGHYEIRHVLGQGGMGTVYLGIDPALQRPVALKVLRSDSEDLRERFRREARIIARLQHPNIVAIYTVGEHDDQPFLAMEYIDGEPLSEGIRRRAPWSLQRRLLMAGDLCAGLAFAHRAGVIHRDVKPSNLMVSNGSGTVRLLDFGIARGDDAAATHGLTLHGNIVGTMNYMSPEQITGQPVDHRSDIFAVGLVLYELLSYCQAFPGSNLATLTYRIVHGQAEPLRELEPTLDPELCAIVDRAMARYPDDRYPHLEAMRTDLLRVAARLSPTAAAAVATEAAEGRPDTPIVPPIWSRALDPTVDSGAPVTPGATPAHQPAVREQGQTTSGVTRRWLVPAASTAAALTTATAVWIGWPRLPAPTHTPSPPHTQSITPTPSPDTFATADTEHAGRSDAAEPSRGPAPRPADPAAYDTRAARQPERTDSAAASQERTTADMTTAAIDRPAVGTVQSSDMPAEATVPASEAARRPEVSANAEPPGATASEADGGRTTPQQSDTDLIQSVITRWARAYAARDARGIDTVMPGAEATYARQFSGLRSVASTVTNCQPSVDGSRATASCTEQFAFELTVGGGSRGTRQRRFVLDKSSGEWRIVSTGVSQ